MVSGFESNLMISKYTLFSCVPFAKNEQFNNFEETYIYNI